MNHSDSVIPLQRSVPDLFPRYWWANVTCIVLTVITTTLFGSALVASFGHDQPLNPDLVWQAYRRFLQGDPSIWVGLEFSIPLLVILLAHELGHYLECRRWQVDATWPYFLPSPSLFGTFGAFIRLKSPILTRVSLFDIGIAGPLAGFAVLLPFLIVGVALSHANPAVQPGPFFFGSPLVLQILERVFFPHMPSAHILLHPMAMAAWAGLLATAINLLPVGQLDGGHIVYATLGPRVHRIVSSAFVLLLAIFGFWYWTWWVWSVVLFFLGRRHPLVYDRTPIPVNRWPLVVVVCLVFLLSFSVVPVRIGS
jgi:membrane-associated protease RseP (regulator of RpoE activity)